jgi:hypothetical protein
MVDVSCLKVVMEWREGWRRLLRTMTAFLPALRSTEWFLRRIWAHKISFFVPSPRDVAHPGSGPAQGRLRAAQDWLSLAHPLSHFWKATIHKNGYASPRLQKANGSDLAFTLISRTYLQLVVYSFVILHLELLTTLDKTQRYGVQVNGVQISRCCQKVRGLAGGQNAEAKDVAC